ncbi:hypothetical protein PUN28_008091 [Cardiocondyla obscurior]|uniref:Uncharacterized protein n=1 Tax=Cardiocondyla obscurior TaxID=286306 RepID=A0AAW2FXM9_9HYME
MRINEQEPNRGGAGGGNGKKCRRKKRPYKRYGEDGKDFEDIVHAPRERERERERDRELWLPLHARRECDLTSLALVKRLASVKGSEKALPEDAKE